MPKLATHGARPKAGMDCPICGVDSKRVTDSRFYRGEKRRRRVCFAGHRFNTTEIPTDELDALRALAARSTLAESVA